jgi:hypothetical protein
MILKLLILSGEHVLVEIILLLVTHNIHKASFDTIINPKTVAILKITPYYYRLEH